MRYVLTGTRVPFLDLPALLPALYFHFVGPAALRAEFPFVFPDDRYPWTCPTVFFNEPTAGLLWHSPFLLALILIPWLLRKSPRPLSPPGTPQHHVLAALGLASRCCRTWRSRQWRCATRWTSRRFSPQALALWMQAERR